MRNRDYWIGTFLSDIIQIVFPCVVFLLFIVIFNVETLDKSLSEVFMLNMSIGITIITGSYLL